MRSHIVIPANAGIKTPQPHRWIPACAGMTNRPSTNDEKDKRAKIGDWVLVIGHFHHE
jgi:hypothetical protein